MEKKKIDKKLISIISAVLAVLIVISAVVWVLATKGVNSEIDNSTNTKTTTSTNTTVNTENISKETQEIQIKNSGIVSGIYTLDGVDYVSDLTGIYKVTKDKKIAVTEQDSFTLSVINKKIVINLKEKT